MNKRSRDLAEDAFIDSGSALGAVIVGGVFGGPSGAYVGTVVAPIVANIVKGLLGPREVERVERVHKLAVEKYKVLLTRSSLRKDIPIEKLAALVEGTLLSARSAYEEKKIPLMANLIAKAPFTNTPIDNLTQTLNQAERMTYRQLCLLSIVEKNSWKKELNLTSKPFMQEEKKHFNELAEGVYQDLNVMLVDGTIGMISDEGKSVMMSSGVGFITPAQLIPLYPGRVLVNGLDLSGLPDSELDYLIKVLR